MKKTAIIDYGSGNVFSVFAAINRLGGNPFITNDPAEIRKADKVILPGVGHAKFAMEQLKSTGLDKVILSLTQPVMGICLGMQLMCEYTEEGNMNGLGIFPNVKVRKFVDSPKVPHIGWNELIDCKGMMKDYVSEVYFVHSYFVEVNPYSTSNAQYGGVFSTSLQKDNFYGCQFHPEKSGTTGEDILRDFLNLKTIEK